MRPDPTRFEYRPPTLQHGPSCIAGIGDELTRLDRERALIVTGRTVGRVADVMEPVRAGIGDALVAHFDDVTPAKTLGTAAEAAEIVRDQEIDVLVGVGGGATLDSTKQVSVLAGYEDPTAAARSMIERGTVSVHGDGPFVDIVAVPTTLAGATLSYGAGVGMSMETDVATKADVPGGGVSDPRLMPAAAFFDASLLATTPPDIRRRSAMNGYDKGIELIYSRHHTPVTDATARHGLALLQSSLPAVAAESPPIESLATVAAGISLVQYGLASPDAYRASIIHAFGHALTAAYPIQQGVAHGIAAPHVLAYLFDEIDGRRALLASALGVGDAADHATAVIEAVERTRDGLGLPTRLRSVDGADRSDIPRLATAVLQDSFMTAAPPALEPTSDDIEAVFAAMW